MRSAFIHSGGIGDILLSCPALAEWLPAGELLLVGESERLAIAQAAGLADAVDSLDAVEFASLFSTPSQRCHEYFNGMDEAVVWMRDDDGSIKRGLESCGVKRVRCFPGLPPSDWNKHATQYYAECLGVNTNPHFQLCLPEIEEHFDVLIHPGSGSPSKNWPFEYFIELTQRLIAQGRNVQWITGPAEEKLSIPLDIARLETRDLIHLGQCLQNTRQYIGNDSGISHLSGILGTPTLTLFGPTNPEVWQALGKHVTVMQGIPWANLNDVQRHLHL